LPEATFEFPDGFLWGTATAAHQVEGQNNNNNWSSWEAEPGRIINGDKAGLACDWWNGRWEEDLQNAARDGQNAHRFSVEWSRIEPEPGKWDESALDHYRAMLKGMRRLGLTPMVTLHHFTDPLWIYEKGGWENDETPKHFEKFARRVVDALKDEVNLWVTLNEPNGLVLNSYVDGGFPPGKKDFKAAYRALNNLIRGHAAAWQAIHDLQSDAMASYALYFRGFFPQHSWSPLDRFAAKGLMGSVNEVFTNAIENGQVKFAFFNDFVLEAVGTQDYIAIQYYSSDDVSFDPFNARELFSRRTCPAHAQLSENGFIANYPDGMTQALDWAHQFRLPIYITENGVEDSKDTLRPSYLARHLHRVWRLANFNYQIKGYFHWSQIDNFEWERGWSQRFGLWELDTKTQKRSRRRSADFYAAICKENGLGSEAVRKYAPEVFDILFPV
jgi:beta-glucosidase